MSGRIGIDTNVLLRIAIPDDARQVDAVSRLLDRLDADDILFINVSVILEASWVLNRKYRYPRDRILDFIQAILERREFEVADYEAVGNAIHICRMSNVDFADALLSEMNRIDDCSKTFTFDKKAAARVPGMELLA
ncbi:type II toxin-antitoxin system VapC family toxin [Rhizobium sp. YS-1r]|uniref:PIN domain-containing protein n=1 Tax=Rhizobium sp. YS-1r TaxID=1532558 RepID=UPI0005107578|nr:type II toxin-antitoxin system VapC family toxin [Rhizobium sp. YS-1r]KGD99824.1 PilT [Rhizobium sp. YS-1r]